uniref:Thioredoxin reductase (EC) n=1 Tax=Ganoderma boninense TaxID=34458 RepID=A0A5K1JYN9_9APHY|nr:Thioredoxin reductase (EC [Ganoderma boninense]
MSVATSTGNWNTESSVQPRRQIPTEVCENIIDTLYSLTVKGTTANIATLHNSSLVCRDWRVRAQKMLFFKVQLSDGASLHRFSAVLDIGQHLRDYVHEVLLTGHHLHTTASILTSFPAVFAGRLPNLWSVTVVHLISTQTHLYPRTPDPPKMKTLPYIPLHRSFPSLLSSFTCGALPFVAAVHHVWLLHRVYADPPEATQLEGSRLQLHSPEELPQGGGIDLSSCVELRNLHFQLKPCFLVDTRSTDLVKAMLTAWKPQHPSRLQISAYKYHQFTREGFADILRALGPIIDAWIPRPQAHSHLGNSRDIRHLNYRLVVRIHEQEGQKQWWRDCVTDASLLGGAVAAAAY